MTNLTMHTTDEPVILPNQYVNVKHSNINSKGKGRFDMKRLSTIQLIPGMVVADDVMTPNHQMILPKDTVLTDAQIIKLELYGILTVHVKDEFIAEPMPQQTSSGLSYFDRVKNSPVFTSIKKVYEEEVDSFKDMIN